MFPPIEPLAPLETWMPDYCARISWVALARLVCAIRSLENIAEACDDASRHGEAFAERECVCDVLLRCADDLVYICPLLEPLYTEGRKTLQTKAELPREWTLVVRLIVSELKDTATHAVGGRAFCCHVTNCGFKDAAESLLMLVASMSCEEGGLRVDILKLNNTYFPKVGLPRRGANALCTTAAQTLRRCVDLAMTPDATDLCARDLFKVLMAVWAVFCEGTPTPFPELEALILSGGLVAAHTRKALKAARFKLAEDVDLCGRWHQIMECAVYDDDEIYLEKGRGFVQVLVVAVKRYAYFLLNADLCL